jgi:2-dehydro-3-deoxyphosphooctonate aldolase (KDO 8-P synthase)
MNSHIEINGAQIGSNSPLLLIAGPCVLESEEESFQIAQFLTEQCREAGVQFVFKGSFDKANRTSVFSQRGLGLDKGLQILTKIKEEFDIPVTTDIHEASQAQPVGEVVDIIQIPAFLCRQTDLLVAAANTNAVVNVKKGQFLSPDEMKHVVIKLQESSCQRIILTERGTFFGYNRLVNDFLGLGDLMEIGPPVCFDVTHSTQLPGAGKDSTAGRPDRALLLAKAATAAGVDALFVECHPTPLQAASDASTMQPLENMSEIITKCASIRQIMQDVGSTEGVK